MTDEDLITALARRDLDAANAGLTTRLPAFRLTVESITSARTAEAVAIWRIERDGSSRFRFDDASWHRIPEELFFRWVKMLPVFAAVLRVGQPGRCAFNLGDEAHRPGLAFCGNRPEHRLIPDYVFLNLQGYAPLARTFAARNIAWEDRARTLFWRGSDTGPSDAEFDDLPRVRLCRIARRFGDDADVTLSALSPPNRARADALAAEGIFADYVPMECFDRYRLHLDIDGNSNSWAGLLAKLHSGGAVLKVASPSGYRQWYYDRLVPWVHYVPVKADMSNLAERLADLRNDDAAARRIGTAGQALARTMTIEAEIARAVPRMLEAFEPLPDR